MQIPMFFLVIENAALILIKLYKSGIHFGSAPESEVYVTVKLPSKRCRGANVVTQYYGIAFNFFAEIYEIRLLYEKAHNFLKALKPFFS
jgi:hypothetical protein